ncbi:DNA polymerase I: 5'-3' exonuclease [Mycoplasmopsis bovigenitalium]|uniref:5'-3' exonuclease n=1 Tax=Mycoplasmopsis bovigenitalium TaxID=2112 RepID=UPI00090B33A1|nr:5'-3' exonuclease [Mycoplasmopsis bovigenitalium]BAW18237.1 DNA polymerase I: 5'-3' exonuclease [Mycoplasmopsis bovigenitalium]
MNKLLLIDGNFMMFQSFYASYYPEKAITMKDDNNRNTNAVHVFFMSLFNLINFVKPTHIFIAFDAHGKTKRHELYPEYKAGRKQTPIEIFDQFIITKEILDSLNITWFEKVGDEGDDIIASVANQNKNIKKIIYSRDQDLLQLVDNNTSVLHKSGAGFIYYSPWNFEQKFKIKPHLIPDFKGLAGDKSDNIKGVIGIGEIGANKLINKYGSIENIYQNINNINGSFKNKLIKGKNDAMFCKRLATLNKNVEINFDFNDFSVANIAFENGFVKMSEFKLNSVIKKWKKLINE